MVSRIVLASDHAGYSLKKLLTEYISDNLNIEVLDLGTDNGSNSVDYPDFAYLLAKKLKKDSSELGVLVCGSGIGISMAANRKKNIRAALCTSPEMAKLARAHNDANVLCLGARITDQDDAIAILDSFLSSSFAKGRHINRVEKLSV